MKIITNLDIKNTIKNLVWAEFEDLDILSITMQQKNKNGEAYYKIKVIFKLANHEGEGYTFTDWPISEVINLINQSGRPTKKEVAFWDKMEQEYNKNRGVN